MALPDNPAMWHTYSVMWSREDSQFVGFCPNFPSLSWLADDPKGALEGIVELVRGHYNDVGGERHEGPPPPLKELDVVRVKKALPGGGGWTEDPDLPAGAVGTIVHVHEMRYEVELTDDEGKTLRVVTVLAHDLERVT